MKGSVMAEKICDGIYRIKIPFEDIYTSVFIFTDGSKSMIFDSGSSDDDVLNYVIPEAERLGVVPDYLLCSHMHSDHCGGMSALTQNYPKAKVGLFSHGIECAVCLSDGEILLGHFKVLNLKGHSDDCLAVFDIKTKTLITGDALQLRGIGRFGMLVENAEEYLNSVNRLKSMEIHKIVASHEYSPYGSIAQKDMVEKYLRECENAVR